MDLKPVYHRKNKQIQVHAFLCFLALLLVRIAERNKNMTWNRVQSPPMTRYPSSVTVNVCPATVIVPVRWFGSLLPATVNATVPFPVALLPEVMVIQLALLVAVQLQPPEAVTLTTLGPPDQLIVWLVGEIEYMHDPGGDCVTVNVCPAMVIVPVRWLVPVLAATAKTTVPFPAPLLPEVMVIQLALLAAVQLELLVTLTIPVPPVQSNDWLVGDIEYVPTACVTVNVCPPMVIVPVRWLVPV